MVELREFGDYLLSLIDSKKCSCSSEVQFLNIHYRDWIMMTSRPVGVLLYVAQQSPHTHLRM